MNRFIVVAALLPALAGCDQIKERMGIPDPAKQEAVGKAIGGACRHAGRGLEDCYQLNPEADKPSVFMGWKEMNEYMIKNNMQAVPPEIPVTPPAHEAKKPAVKDKDGAEAADGHDGEGKDGAAKDKDKAEGQTEDANGEDKAKTKADAKPEPHGKPAGGH